MSDQAAVTQAPAEPTKPGKISGLFLLVGLLAAYGLVSVLMSAKQSSTGTSIDMIIEFRDALPGLSTFLIAVVLAGFASYIGKLHKRIEQLESTGRN